MKYQEQIASINLQVKSHQFIESLYNGLSKPEQKFLKEIVIGLISAGSVKIRKISKTIKSNIQAKSICTRFYRNLKKEGLTNRLQTNLLEKQCRGFDKDTLILVDTSDISKDYARNMEGISKVYDGSKKSVGTGYSLLNFVALKHTDKGYELIPLVSELYSNDLEEESLSTKTNDYIDDITVYSNNRGIFVFDRGGDTKHNLLAFSNNNNSYIIRSVGKRNIVYKGIEMNFKNFCNKIELNYEIKGSGNKASFIAGVRRVKVLVDDHPSKKANYIETNVVIAKYKNTKRSFFFLFCDFPDQDLTDEEIINKALAYYRLRWKIEEVHREIKASYSWEAMQLWSYIGLKNLNTILFVAVSFVYSLIKIVLTLVKTLPRFILDKKSDIKKLYKFLYYRLCEVAKFCLAYTQRYRTNRYKRKNNNELLLGLTMVEKM